MDYTPSDNEKTQTETQAEAQAKTQGSKAGKKRVTLGEENKARRLKETALKIPSCCYLIDYNENSKTPLQ